MSMYESEEESAGGEEERRCDESWEKKTKAYIRDNIRFVPRNCDSRGEYHTNNTEASQHS